MNKIRKITEYPAVFAIGAGIYSFIEILWRGFTHWTMALTGGACFLGIYLVNRKYTNEKLWKKCFAGELIITLAELIVGFVVNILLHWKVWDYSGLKLNLFGQISALYSTLWFFLCFAACGLCTLLRRIFEKKS